MTKAIGIKVKKAEGEHDLGASKFFGTPTLPSGMAEAFKDTEIFFCQIRCRDIAEAGLIAENDERIPHSGISVQGACAALRGGACNCNG